MSFCSCTTDPMAINQTTCQNPINFQQAVKAILDIPSLVARFQRTCAFTSNHANEYINTSTSQQPTNITAYLRTHNDENSEATACHARAGRCCWNLWARGIPRGGANAYFFCLAASTPAELEEGSLFRRSGLARRREPQKVRTQREDRVRFSRTEVFRGDLRNDRSLQARVRLVTLCITPSRRSAPCA
jgi:hypothetical protein